MKYMNIFGRKISVVAGLLIALLVGTASAALIEHYTTLSGEVEVTNPISVAGDGDSDMLDMTDDTAGFTITNTDSNAINVEVVTTLYLDLPEAITEDMSLFEVNDVEGIEITVDGKILECIDGSYVPVTVSATGVTGLGTPDDPFVPGETIVPVIFEADPGVVPGVYTIQVEVNPSV